ncbi:helix-turn-helix domain-containing protein [Staphylococcus auricularis]|uniref:XRE family transcriptional regulator n=1 Tax=Staphylococcus auricularis TaxID=29379 RepID=A0ABX5IFV8_9STAP|nr:helix-turn-helix transcriptional regulator [Staphylococcus auricularis]PTH18473.1 XRE family transcriptional regulator [Staphylococcus auricularis]PTH23196.1 XRE family transcriptional regulator [Staphylococcus auricularis]
MKLSENIRKYRKEMDFTQEGLAEQLNTTRQTISKWEQGTLEPDVQTLVKLSELFHVSLDQLITGKELQPKNDETVKVSHEMNFWEFASQKWWVVIILALILAGTLSSIFN